MVEMIAAERIDLIEISGGSYESPAMMGRPAVSARTRDREAYFLDYAETIREVAAAVPLAVTGGFRTRTGMADAIASGACDVVGLGRRQFWPPTRHRASWRIPRRRSRPRNDPSNYRVASPAPPRSKPSMAPWTCSGTPISCTRWEPVATLIHTDHCGAQRSPPSDAMGSTRFAVSVGTSAPQTRRPFGSSGIERAVGRYIANPVVASLTRVGITTSFATELETIGRRTGRRRTVPVSAAFDETGAWVISQHGARSGWANNISANPAVHIKQGRQWRSGTAAFVHDDDVAKRVRTFAPNPVFASLTAASFRALQSDPVSVRISFTDR